MHPFQLTKVVSGTKVSLYSMSHFDEDMKTLKADVLTCTMTHLKSCFDVQEQLVS